jgi:hypothetical protein
MLKPPPSLLPPLPLPTRRPTAAAAAPCTPTVTLVSSRLRKLYFSVTSFWAEYTLDPSLIEASDKESWLNGKAKVRQAGGKPGRAGSRAGMLFRCRLVIGCWLLTDCYSCVLLCAAVARRFAPGDEPGGIRQVARPGQHPRPLSHTAALGAELGMDCRLNA